MHALFDRSLFDNLDTEGILEVVAAWIGADGLAQADGAPEAVDVYAPLSADTVARGDCGAMRELAQALVTEVSQTRLVGMPCCGCVCIA